MAGFSYVSVKICIGVIKFELFTLKCFKYIMKTCEIIWIESNMNIDYLETLIKHYNQCFHCFLFKKLFEMHSKWHKHLKSINTSLHN